MAFQYKRRTQEQTEARANQQGGGFEGFIKDEFRQYSPKTGDNAIRILPRDASENATHYGEDVYVHYNVGPERATVICTQKMLGEPCVCCEDRMRCERIGDEEAAKELKPSRRVVLWLLDRKSEDTGPQVWGMPWTVDRDIAKVCRDRETGEFFFIDDPEKGYDVFFDRSGNPPLIDYTGFQLARRPSTVPDKILEFIAANPILSTLRMRSYEEVKRLFEGGRATQQQAESSASQKESRRPALERPDRTPEGKKEETSRAPDPDPSLEADRRAINGEDTQSATPKQAESAPQSTVISGTERARLLRETFAKKRAGENK